MPCPAALKPLKGEEVWEFHRLLHSISDNGFSLSSLHLFYKSPRFEYFVPRNIYHLDSEVPGADLTEPWFVNHGLPSQHECLCVLKRKKNEQISSVMFSSRWTSVFLYLHLSDALPNKSGMLRYIGVDHFCCSECEEASGI